jgi:DNA-binding LacI/PurR family transcriptional regulator
MKNSTRATIRDVAAAAGVTPTTVSDALTGKGRLSAETRVRVREVASQLGYRPNALARGLRGKGLGLLGLVISPAPSATLSTVWYWSTIANKATETAFASGFALVLLPHNAEVLSSMPIPLDGAIVVDPIAHDPVLKVLRDSGMFVVTVGRDPENEIEPWVDDDNARGARQLLGRTVRPGSRLAMLTMDPRKSYAHDARMGAQQWADDTKSTFFSQACSGLEPEAVDLALDTVLSQKVNAILVQNDKLAIVTLARLQARGIRVPGDVLLLSATDSPDLPHTKPSITATHQHPERLGQLAASALIDSIHGSQPPGRQMVALDLIIRRSAPALRG